MTFSVGVKRLEPGDRQNLVADQALVDRAKRKDVEAFGKIVDAYQSRVLGFVRRMVLNEDEALDVTQEVFIKAFRAVDRFDGRCSLRTWLFRIAHNLCIDRARKVSRSAHVSQISLVVEEDEEREVADMRFDPASALLQRELSQVLEESLAAMSEKLRIVLILHDQEDMSYEEIATTVDIPVGTVKSRLFLARAFLQNRLKGYFYGANS
ncbi:MAG: sigma-70 family RNA polymerase sigma factor [Fimbriimonadaceae bacterium]|jgi:RNA polymerase sigma-70 factor (ECF subfamily)|nr:sigma-70 family RNA polymerase sigma factor [Fimbriimonadaceae bacterium]